MTIDRIAFVLSVGALALTIGGCASPSAPARASEASESIPPERLEMGRTAFGTAMCVKCHGEDGKGSEKAPDLTSGTWHHCDGSVEGILGVLRRGVAKADFADPSRPFGMQPATKRIQSEDELLALAQYVWSLSHAPTLE